MSRLYISNPGDSHSSLNSEQLRFFQRQHYLRGRLSAATSGADVRWQEFHQAWDDLVADQYMGDGGHYRRRRYSVFNYDTGLHRFAIQADQLHYQSRSYNPLNGGIYREYPPFTEAFLENPLFQTILQESTDIVTSLSPDAAQWRIEGHQFRILATAAENGKPTPEGIHKDGRDYVLVLMVERDRIRGGDSRIYDRSGRMLQRWTMRKPLEYMIIDDRQLLHYVSAIEPRKAETAGHRDVLVLTYRKID